jgi:Short C-terminal domain
MPAMALLSQMFRSAAITGNTDYMNAWFADRQGGRWAEQRVRAALPRVPGAASPRLSELAELRHRGVITDAEFERLRARLHV